MARSAANAQIASLYEQIRVREKVRINGRGVEENFQDPKGRPLLRAKNAKFARN
jgi:hypothetical protein